ncbi:MAG TPA: N-6 DNA methylase [Spirochaetota bacterium]|nr:N-6 DNA methylase [Spirochaetota bacterium]
MDIKNSNRIYSISESSDFFGVTTSTIKNWIKCGFLKLENNKITCENLQLLQNDIKNGKLPKLNKRANKSEINKTFIPKEYLDKSNIHDYYKIIEYISTNKLNLKKSLKYLLINYLINKNLLSIEDDKIFTEKKNLLNEINKWNIDLKDEKYFNILKFVLPEHNDPVGFIYQSLFEEGKKSKMGSYYTPNNVIAEIKNNYAKENHKFLDPCCGTGQFLLEFGDIIKNPENIYGCDIDGNAVTIAKINLIIKYKEIDFSPKIFCINSLLELSNDNLLDYNKSVISNNYFDIIATNPPWGFHFSKYESHKLKEKYPMIKSDESFSYFLVLSLKLLKNDGVLSFILPESILNVKIHSDIRNYLLTNFFMEKIISYGRIFKKVFTPVIRLDIRKQNEPNEKVEVINKKNLFLIDQKKWINGNDNILTTNISYKDIEIIEKIYSYNHTTLKENAVWALGIVTGNNKGYLFDKPDNDLEPIFTGKEVLNYKLSKPQKYIKFTPQYFQQVADETIYRADEKLVYKFISKYLVFAYDNKQSLTLNSANIVIPKIDYPIKVILALFNSPIYQFIFMKKFNSIKVLRNHIEALPLPYFDDFTIKKIESLIDKIILDNYKAYDELNDYIFECFKISEDEKKYIVNSI